MTSPAPHPTHPEDHETCRLALLALMEEGVRMARVVSQRAEDDVKFEAATTRGYSEFRGGLEAATAYERAARTVRRCVLLLQKVNDPAWWTKAAPTPQAAPRAGKMVRAGEGLLTDEADPDEFLTQDIQTDRIDQADRVETAGEDVTPATLAEVIGGMQRQMGQLAAQVGAEPEPDHAATAGSARAWPGAEDAGCAACGEAAAGARRGPEPGD